jgi:hypothetical protein
LSYFLSLPVEEGLATAVVGRGRARAAMVATRLERPFADSWSASSYHRVTDFTEWKGI